MCKLKVSDFYYGAFLSAFLNNPGGPPSLFDETDARNIYRLDTNNSNDGYIFYVKCIRRSPTAAGAVLNGRSAELRRPVRTCSILS